MKPSQPESIYGTHFTWYNQVVHILCDGFTTAKLVKVAWRWDSNWYEHVSE